MIHETKYQEAALSPISVIPTLEFNMTAILVLLMIMKQKYDGGVASHGMMTIPRITKIYQVLQMLLREQRDDTYTQVP
jgi:hypothetical protein